MESQRVWNHAYDRELVHYLGIVMDSVPSYETIGRLSRYRRLLTRRVETGSESVYSHELAAVAGVSAAQVRRDMMAAGANGSPTSGYDVAKLIECLGSALDAPEGRRAAVVPR